MRTFFHWLFDKLSPERLDTHAHQLPDPYLAEQVRRALHPEADGLSIGATPHGLREPSHDAGVTQ